MYILVRYRLTYYNGKFLLWRHISYIKINSIRINARFTWRNTFEHHDATKGVLVKNGVADRTPRETLEEHLEKTPSDARCFAQGSSSIC